MLFYFFIGIGTAKTRCGISVDLSYEVDGFHAAGFLICCGKSGVLLSAGFGKRTKFGQTAERNLAKQPNEIWPNSRI